LEQGWVYLLVNASIPGLVKVGQTTGLPKMRAAELSRHTGVATPFVLVFEQAFADCVAAERDVHAILDRCGMRYKPNREFFFGPIPEIIQLLLEYARETGDGIAPSSRSSGQELLRLGDRYLVGEDDTLQDFGEAMRCYQLAAKRGSIVAFERLGAIVAQVHCDRRGGTTRAIGYLKEGARRGNYYCYCELASIAANEVHVANFMKAWDQFFLQRAAAPMGEAELGRNRYTLALQRYIVSCFSLGIVPGHVDTLRADGEALVRSLRETQAALQNAPERFRSLVPPLRWCCRTLLGRPYPGDERPELWSWLPFAGARRHSATA
jgi:hypothetical protein